MDEITKEMMEAQIEGYMSGYEDALGETPTKKQILEYVRTLHLSKRLVAFLFLNLLSNEEDEDD